jgi:serine/threonine protein kinase
MSRASRVEASTVLGSRYRLLRVVGSGGMGTVWEAEDEILGRRVAVKVLSERLARSDRALRRFEREARAAARLSGPHIGAVYDFGEDRGVPFIVMELVAGETVAARLFREGRIAPEEATWIAADIADALEAAHREGVVHRDVKPANVMLAPEGGVRVMDFGIAAAEWQAASSSTGAIGTPSYVAPEQARGEPATPASDVYALGAMVYEMLSGRPPFVRETPLATALAHVRDEPVPIEDIVPGVPASVAATVDAALRKDPADRPPSAAAMASALRGATAVLPPIADEAPDPEKAVTIPLEPVPAPAADAGDAGGETSRRPSLRMVLAGLALLIAIPLILELASDPLPRELRRPGLLRHNVTVSSSPSPAVTPTQEMPSPSGEDSGSGEEGSGHGGSPPYGNGQGNGPDGDEG